MELRIYTQNWERRPKDKEWGYVPCGQVKYFYTEREMLKGKELDRERWVVMIRLYHMEKKSLK